MIYAFARKYKYVKLEIKDVAQKVIAHFGFLGLVLFGGCFFFSLCVCVFREKRFSNTGKMLHSQLHEIRLTYIKHFACLI